MTIKASQFKIGYLSLGYFVGMLVWAATTYGSSFCEVPRTIGFLETITLLLAMYGIFVLGQFWGERNTPADEKRA